MDSRRLPDFIVIGAVKAATTWIAHQLREHPNVFMPGPEPHYFSTEYDKGLDWYARWFGDAPAGMKAGEKSADYLAHEHAAQRIAKLLPNVPLIVQLRNPVERAYSDYCMLFRRGTVGPDPRRYLAGPAAKSQRFLKDGLYAAHLARYHEYFPPEQTLVILHDEIRARPEQVLDRVWSHLGLDAVTEARNIAARKNDSEAAMLPLSVRKLLAPLKSSVRPLRGNPLFEALRGTIARPPEYPPLTEDLRLELEDFYRSDIERLEAMLGRDLGSWLPSRNERAVMTA